MNVRCHEREDGPVNDGRDEDLPSSERLSDGRAENEPKKNNDTYKYCRLSACATC